MMAKPIKTLELQYPMIQFLIKILIKNWIVGWCNLRVFIGLAIMVYINNSRHLAWKYARIFVRGHYLFREANSFPRAKLEENCELQGTDNVQGQISKDIFAPNGGYCLYFMQRLSSKTSIPGQNRLEVWFHVKTWWQGYWFDLKTSKIFISRSALAQKPRFQVKVG